LLEKYVFIIKSALNHDKILSPFRNYKFATETTDYVCFGNLLERIRL